MQTSRQILMRWAGLILCLACAGTGWADRYVSLDGAHQDLFTTWANAATNLHDAVAVATNGETVWISNGVFAITGQVTVATNITIKGAFGRDATVLAGGYPAVTNRCFTINYGSAWLDSLTISNFCLNAVPNADGGGVYLSKGNITNCLVTHNRVYAGYWGAGVYIGTTWNGLVTDCTFSYGTNASFGGGIGIGNGAIGIIRNCEFYMNYAANGGAMFLYGGITIENCIMRDNTGGNGGGVNLGGGASTLRNCLIMRNVATSQGGGFLSSVSNHSFSVINCSIVSNYSAGGGGIRLVTDTTPGEQQVIVNCIVYSNLSANITLNSSAVQTNWFYNSCVGNYNLPASQGNFTNHPRFVNADPNNADYRLTASSPCINTGTNQSWMNDTVDLDGRRRIDWFSGQVDMGAYEYTPRGAMIIVR